MDQALLRGFLQETEVDRDALSREIRLGRLLQETTLKLHGISAEFFDFLAVPIVGGPLVYKDGTVS